MLTVLVADDEFSVLQVLCMALESDGHRVLRAGDGADALRILVSQPCDIVLCDDVMPLMSGPQLIDAMRADPRLVGVPVLLMVDGYRRPRAGGHPEIVELSKPVRLGELSRILVDMVAASGGPRTRRP